jgi:hypothetical protein
VKPTSDGIACRVDGAALEVVIAAWTAGRLSSVDPGAGRVAVAVDGKTVRGARVGEQPPRTCSPPPATTGRWPWRSDRSRARPNEIP